MIRVLVIAGPTAVGKSRIAVEVAKRTHGEIVSSDSRQVYRYLDIGNGRISECEMDGVPHHLIGFLDPVEPYSAGRFARDASMVLEDIHRRGNTPIICGGTGFYIRALLDGLFDEEAVVGDKSALVEARRTLQKDLERVGPVGLYERLMRVDPLTAKRVHPNDSRRVIRALEIYTVTERPLSDFHEKQTVSRPGIDALKVCITLPRRQLYKRIEERIDKMIASGLIEEVRGLLQEGCTRDCPAFEALGYREVVRYLDGAAGLQETVDRIKVESRRYAKRQLTWFRRDSGYAWVTAGPECVDDVLEAWHLFIEMRGD